MEPESEDPSAYAVYGAPNAAFGPASSDIGLRDPALVVEATAAAIAFDLANPSVEFPPALHPEAYAEVRELLARRLASAREGLPDAR